MAWPDLDLAPERRNQIVRDLRTALEGAIAGSSFALRGSLAEGNADEYSDIDAVWRVPDGNFQTAVDALAHAVEAVGEVFSVRVDTIVSAEGRCLVFVTFADLPVFWRFDVSIETASGFGAVVIDRAMQGSSAESALANAVACVKAVRRGRIEDALGLFQRGYERVGRRYEPTGSWRTDVVRLADQVALTDARLEARAEEVRHVADTMLP